MIKNIVEYIYVGVNSCIHSQFYRTTKKYELTSGVSLINLNFFLVVDLVVQLVPVFKL